MSTETPSTGERRTERANLLEKPAAKPIFAVGSLGLTAAGAGVLFFFDPSTSTFYPPCPFHALTGGWCPGCGTTRALHELLHGDLVAAFGLNPLMVLALPLLGYSALSLVTAGPHRRPLPDVLASPLAAHLALWTILLYWVLRNVPLYPFSLLAP